MKIIIMIKTWQACQKSDIKDTGSKPDFIECNEERMREEDIVGDRKVVRYADDVTLSSRNYARYSFGDGTSGVAAYLDTIQHFGHSTGNCFSNISSLFRISVSHNFFSTGLQVAPHSEICDRHINYNKPGLYL